ncbi:hypothetical protein HBA54_27315 [Pelagibius litoralis]|uniref:Uncharacterized protein n=1 Tax=Pelagibius litoralis TaxID=374515 RepID=A0A967F3A5_9PROT|nr:hypothetical protein [Pelagibius litoralis]NIA72305.1 hypothetical protein [Pelagibius litoralis]
MQMFELDFETAALIRRVYLPRNPNKIRNADPAVKAAVVAFIAAIERGPLPPEHVPYGHDFERH